MTDDAFWPRFWDGKAGAPTDFQATGRGGMDVVGFLFTMREAARLLALRPDDAVLDIGCGTGLLALALSPFVARVHAVDVSRAMVGRARRNLEGVPNVSVEAASITELRQPAASFDKVLAYSVLQYLPDEAAVAAALAEIARVLRPGGAGLLAANPDPARRDRLVEAIHRKPDADARRTELELLDKTCWIAPERLAELARATGRLRAEALPISPRIWQHFYMFDLLVTADG